MRLVNTDGMAFIGPGSEWFWSAIGVLITSVTLIAIYRQLRLSRSANAFEQLSKLGGEWTTSERLTRNRLRVLLALRDGKDPADLPVGAADNVSDFWEGMGSLVRAGHIDRRLVYDAMGGTCQWWWQALAPFIRKVRAEESDPLIAEHHEWLAGIMADIDRQRGLIPAYDEASFRSSLATRIRSQEDGLRVAEELRTVIVRDRVDDGSDRRAALERPQPDRGPEASPD